MSGITPESKIRSFLCSDLGNLALSERSLKRPARRLARINKSSCQMKEVCVSKHHIPARPAVSQTAPLELCSDLLAHRGQSNRRSRSASLLLSGCVNSLSMRFQFPRCTSHLRPYWSRCQKWSRRSGGFTRALADSESPLLCMCVC